MGLKRSLFALAVTSFLLVHVFSTCFIASASPQPWSFRKTITIKHTMVDADLTNFPVPIDLTDAAEQQGVGNQKNLNNGDTLKVTIQGTVS